jgi:hypothetical protein
MYADTRIDRRAVAARRPNVCCPRHDRREELTEYHQFFDGQCVVERSEGAADKHPALPPAAGMAQDPLSLGGSYHNPRVVDVGEVGRLLVSGLSVSPSSNEEEGLLAAALWIRCQATDPTSHSGLRSYGGTHVTPVRQTKLLFMSCTDISSSRANFKLARHSDVSDISLLWSGNAVDFAQPRAKIPVERPTTSQEPRNA